MITANKDSATKTICDLRLTLYKQPDKIIEIMVTKRSYNGERKLKQGDFSISSKQRKNGMKVLIGKIAKWKEKCYMDLQGIKTCHFR
jgi:DNA modification methylase